MTVTTSRYCIHIEWDIGPDKLRRDIHINWWWPLRDWRLSLPRRQLVASGYYMYLGPFAFHTSVFRSRP